MRAPLLPISDRAAVSLIFLLAFGLRFAYVLTDLSIPLVNDMGVYHQLAMGLVSGEGYHSGLEPHFQAFRAPGYPFFLAGLYFVFGPSPAVALFLHAWLGALTCVFVYWIGSECWSRQVGLIAGILCCVNPEAIHWTREILTETLFSFLLALLVLLCVRLSKGGDRRLIVGAGLVLGYATLTRPNLLLLIPFLVLYFLFLTDLPRPRRVLIALALPLLCALVLTPWTIRNGRVLDAFVPVATIGGYALHVSIPPEPASAEHTRMPDWQYLELGHHSMPNGYDMGPELFGLPAPEHPRLPPDFDEVEESAHGRDLYLQQAIERPGRFLGLVATKASLAFNVRPRPFPRRAGVDYGFGPWDHVIRYKGALYFFALFAFGALGMIASFDHRRPVVLLDLVFLYHVAFQILFRPALRYFLPGLIVCSVLAAGGLVVAARPAEWYRAQGRAGPWKLAIFGLALTGLAANTVYQLFVLRRVALAYDWGVILSLLSR